MMDKKLILKILANAISYDSKKILECSEHTKLVDIGLESINFIQFIVKLEEEFDIEVSDSDLLLSNFETIEKLFSTLEKYFYKDFMIKKVVICDCDNVLWNGVAGEEEIFVETEHLTLQKELVKLYNSGALLCLCSKNKMNNILEALNHDIMLIKKEHIIIFKVDCMDKPSNVKEIIEELNLSTNSVVFLDDSSYEIGLMNAMIPELTTIKVSYPGMEFINQLNFWFRMSVLGDQRTRQYREQKEREKERVHFETVEEYNDSLETTYYCEVATKQDAERIAELSNRTNQFNLADMRYSEEKIRDLMSRDDFSIIALSACDKYGDMGIIGAAVVEHGCPAVIRGFFLSCRVFGRGFENVLIKKIKSMFETGIIGIYRPTEKNERFAHFYLENGVKSCE